jgi:hypothetical protein
MKIDYLQFPLADLCNSIGFMPAKYCYDCPFMDKELDFCIWYHRRVEDPTNAEFCKVRKVTIELSKE